VEVGIKRHGEEKVVAGVNVKKRGNVLSKEKKTRIYMK
jgi:hypothetical protein